MRVSTAYLAASHANEMQSLLTYALLHNEPLFRQAYDIPPDMDTSIPGVLPLIVHAEAMAFGGGLVRCIGPDQIQNHYGGDDINDPEDRAADRTLARLGRYRYDTSAVVLDDHDNETPGLRFVRVGSVASRRTIAAAHIVAETTNFLISDDTFTEEVLTGAILEEPAVNGLVDYIETSKRRYANLYRLSHESPESLDEYYKSIIGKLVFYRKIEIPTLNEKGEFADYLEELEAIKVDQAFTPLYLSQRTREHFGIGEHETPVSRDWGHRNKSKIIDKAGRRLYFGSLFCSIDGLEPAGGIWVQQREMVRRRN